MWLGNADIPDPPDDGATYFLVVMPNDEYAWLPVTHCDGE